MGKIVGEKVDVYIPVLDSRNVRELTMKCTKVLLVVLATAAAALFVDAHERTRDNGILNCRDAYPLLQIGSRTVYPIAERHSTQYPNPHVAALPLLTGSSLGMQNFLAGGSQIATMSRALKPSDYDRVDCDSSAVVNNVATAPCQGRLPLGALVGRDMLAIVFNTKAFWIPETGITFQQLQDLTSGTKLLSDIFEGAPAEEPLLFVPDVFSGTRDFFEDEVNNLGDEPGYVDDLQIIEGVVANPDGVGIAPLSAALASSDRVFIAPIDGRDPTDTADQDDYVLARPLYKYFDNAPEAQNIKEREFICQLLTDEGQSTVAAAGFVQLDPSQASSQRALLQCPDLAVPESKISLTGAMREKGYCRDSQYLVLIGSSTVYPISQILERTYPSGFVVPIARSVGSTTGILDLLSGAADIAAASRAIKSSDYGKFGCDEDLNDGNGIASGECQGVLPRGIQIGNDNLAVVINKNSPVLSCGQSLSSAELADIFVNARSYPGTSTMPTLVVPDTLSGTRDFFEDVVGKVDADGFTDDKIIRSRIAADPNAIGFLGAAFVTDEVCTIAIDNRSTDDSGYSLSRPLFYYYDASPDATSKVRSELLCYMMSPEGQEVTRASGYLPVESRVIDAQRVALLCP